MRVRSLASLALLPALLLAAGPGSAQTLERGVVIDALHGQALVMLPEGGIEAVDLADGSRRWHSRSGDLPMAVAGASVVALSGPAKRGLIHYAFIDLATGLEQSSHYAPLPTPARALVDDRLGERFEIKADADAVHWTYRHAAVTGALLANDHGPTPDGVTPDKASEETSAVALSGALRIDAAQAKLVADTAKAGAQGKSLPVEMGRAQPGMPRRFRSADGTHVLVSRDLGGGRYEWKIEDAQGQTLGRFEHDWSYLPFLVADGAVLFVRPLAARIADGDAHVDFPTLIAMDLAKGAPRWEKEIRDTTFRGPYPP